MNKYSTSNFFLNQEQLLSLWLSNLEKRCKNIFTSSLHNIKLVANQLNLLDIDSFVFIITGTNGKGTTCLILEQLLISSGYRVGLYTSPHLIQYVERVRINGNYLSPSEHLSAFDIVEHSRKNIKLTYFEFITLASLFLFKKEKLDILILEVGIGGRIDATNILNADIAVITNIGIDHSNLLGSDRSSIGYEKSGIFRSKKIAIIGDKNIPNIVYNIIEEKKIFLRQVVHDWNWRLKSKTWDFINKDYFFTNLPLPMLSLENVTIAIATLCFSNFKVSEEIIRSVIKNLIIPGRFHIVLKKPLVILDVCHNPHAAVHLSKQLLQIKKNKNIYAVVGMLKDKDVYGTFQPLIPLIKFWYCAYLDTERSFSGKDLKKYLPDVSKEYNCVHNAFESALNNSNNNDIILVFGSFFTVSSVLNFIKNKY